MPWLPMYLIGDDVDLVVAHVDEDPELAWFVGGAGHWMAQARHGELRPKNELWHVPSGALPLLNADFNQAPAWISDPWRGWTEQRPGRDPSTPYFADHPGTYTLSLRTDPALMAHAEQIGISSFEWIGNYYKDIGNPAHPRTDIHWKGLRRWASKVARRIPRQGPIESGKAEVFAFPSALRAIADGAQRALNPYLL